MATNESSALPAADFGSRFSAFMIDAALLFAAQWVVVIVLSRQLQAVGLTSQEPCATDAARMCEGPSTSLWLIAILLLLATTVGYHAFFEGRYSATPGKKWMNLRVVSLAGLQPLGLAVGGLRAVVRQAFWLSLFFVFDASPLSVSLPPVLFILVPAAALALTAYAAVAEDGRGVHDLVAGTQVVRNDQMPAQTTPPSETTATAYLGGAVDDSSEESQESEESV